jgi:ABC-type phosphate transport system substrate-binding protein
MTTTRSGTRVPWRQARFLLYLLVVAGLFLARGGIRWGNLIPSSPTGAGDTLLVAGRDLAPGLVDRVIDLYRRDYPDLEIVVRGGGTNHALEDLINREADVAFLVRPPREDEQGLFRAVGGDSVLWFPVALGGIALLTQREADPGPILPSDLRRSWDEGASFPFDRVYVPDPNRGLWDVLRDSLGIPREEPEPGGRIVFLRDETEIVAAVQSDPGALGVASTLALPEPLPSGVAMARVGGESAGQAVLPTYENIGLGGYPLFHVLYAACRSDGDIQGAKFVTYLTSGPGQRRIERAGYVPALRYLREVVLTTHPVGK